LKGVVLSDIQQGERRGASFMSKFEVISVQVQKNDQNILDLFKAEVDMDYFELETSSFDGQSEIVTLVITLAPLVIALVGKIVSEQIKKQRYIKVIYKGLQIQGMSDENVTRLIEKLIEKE
jgi:hypothetical protein